MRASVGLAKLMFRLQLAMLPVSSSRHRVISDIKAPCASGERAGETVRKRRRPARGSVIGGCCISPTDMAKGPGRYRLRHCYVGSNVPDVSVAPSGIKPAAAASSMIIFMIVYSNIAAKSEQKISLLVVSGATSNISTSSWSYGWKPLIRIVMPDTVAFGLTDGQALMAHL